MNPPLVLTLIQLALLGVIVVLLLRRHSGNDRLDQTLRDEARAARSEAADQSRAQREELANQLQRLTHSIEGRLEVLRGAVDQQLRHIQASNEQKLEQMRKTVDEQLQSTLQKRLGESFTLVSKQLEAVQRGLGEMQTLAADVGGLKRVLSNVKTRGIFGETQLGALLEQVLAPEQYAVNIPTKPGSNDRVEFAIRLPGRDDSPAWLPIDAKFPREDYERLLDAQERADRDAAESAAAALEARIRLEAKSISA